MSRPSPTVRRRRIAAELKRLREGRGLTLDQAASELGVARSTMSRIENAQVSVRPGDVGRLLELYRVGSDDIAALVQVARDARQRGWWQTYSDVLPTWFEVYVGLEDAASVISVFGATLVPDLLQTAQYAQAVVEAGRPAVSPRQVERRIEFHARRQRRESRPQMSVVLDEAVIHRVVGGPTAMRGQLERLAGEADAQAVTLQIIPFDVGAHASMVGAFSILTFPDVVDRPVVYLENRAGSPYIEGADTQIYGRIFQSLQDIALSPAASVRRIREFAKAM
jgi:transcriptional regulator with XRE-family HTH domain